MSSTLLHGRQFRPALLALACAAPILVFAQNPVPQQPPADAQQAQPLPDPDKDKGPRNQRIEHIHVQDHNATVDELRVGGQTQSITVKPNSNAPAYNVMPNSPDHPGSQGQPDQSPNDTSRVWWNIFKF
jgi:hypothetical protein